MHFFLSVALFITVLLFKLGLGWNNIIREPWLANGTKTAMVRPALQQHQWAAAQPIGRLPDVQQLGTPEALRARPAPQQCNAAVAGRGCGDVGMWIPRTETHH